MYYEAETQFHEWLGEKNAKYQIARNMLDKNIPIAEIAEMTGLTSEEVAKAATETVAVPGKDSSLQQ
jgi:predicted transposase YdaD